MNLLLAWRIWRHKRAVLALWKQGKRGKWRSEGRSEWEIRKRLKVYKVLSFFKILFIIMKKTKKSTIEKTEAQDFVPGEMKVITDPNAIIVIDKEHPVYIRVGKKQFFKVIGK